MITLMGERSAIPFECPNRQIATIVKTSAFRFQSLRFVALWSTGRRVAFLDPEVGVVKTFHSVIDTEHWVLMHSMLI